MANMGGINRSKIKDTYFKPHFIARLDRRFQRELGVSLQPAILKAMFEILLDEVKRVVFRGDAVMIKDFGTFYAKHSARRTVAGKLNGTFASYLVPHRIRLGFSAGKGTTIDKPTRSSKGAK